MAYDGKLLARARVQLDKIRAANADEHMRRIDEMYAKVPELEQLEAQMRSQMTELVRLTLSRGGNVRQGVEELKKQNLDAQMRRAELLVEHGRSIDYLDDIYSCPKCKDSGMFDGALCSCVVRLYNEELTKELGTLLQTGDECFERFDLKLYSDEYDEALKTSPRQWMSQVFSGCRKFAANFPDVSSNLLLHGGTGLGKTFLSACIAREVANKGYSVCYDSASSALEAFERQKFSRSVEESEEAAVRVRRMLSCELMILDDLGTEMVTNMSLSALYTLINTRLVNKKPIIISTNCDLAELERRYTPQICSRISGEFIDLPFVGRDIRKLKRS